MITEDTNVDMEMAEPILTTDMTLKEAGNHASLF